MNPSDEIRLCGGILFAVLLTCRKQRTRHNSFGAHNNDGLDEISVLYGLAKVVDPSSTKPRNIESNIKTIVSRYKSCEGEAKGVLPFNDRLIAEAFDKQIKTDWNSAIKNVQAFCNDFLSQDSRKSHLKLAVAILLELINRDPSISNDQQFHVLQDGSSISKKEICDVSRIVFEPFILGVLHFVVTERQDNLVGKATYNFLFPSKAGGKRSMDATRFGSSLPDIEIDLYKASCETSNVKESEHEAVNAKANDHGFTGNKASVSFTQNNFNGPIGQFIEKVDSMVNINYGK